MEFKTDIEIAQSCQMKPILEIAKTGTIAIERGSCTIYDNNKLREEYNYGKNVL